MNELLDGVVHLGRLIRDLPQFNSRQQHQFSRETSELVNTPA